MAELPLSHSEPIPKYEQTQPKNDCSAGERVLLLHTLDGKEEIMIDSTIMAHPDCSGSGKHGKGNDGANDDVNLDEHEYRQKIVIGIDEIESIVLVNEGVVFADEESSRMREGCNDLYDKLQHVVFIFKHEMKIDRICPSFISFQVEFSLIYFKLENGDLSNNY
jgi:hypothetical protein